MEYSLIRKPKNDYQNYKKIKVLVMEVLMEYIKRDPYLNQLIRFSKTQFGQLSNGISNSIISGIVYWLIAAIVMGILFIITGFLIIKIGYQVGKIYRKYCWDILSIMVAIMSTAIVIYFGEWIKSVIPINLIVLLLLVHVIYIGI